MQLLPIPLKCPHCGAKIKETLIKSNSPRSNAHTHAAEFDTLRFNQRILKNKDVKIFPSCGKFIVFPSS